MAEPDRSEEERFKGEGFGAKKLGLRARARGAPAISMIYKALRGHPLRRGLSRLLAERGVTLEAVISALVAGLDGRETRTYPYARAVHVEGGLNRKTTRYEHAIDRIEVVDPRLRLQAAELAGRFMGLLRPEAAPAPEEAAASRPSVTIHIGCCDGGPAHPSHAKIVTRPAKPVGAGSVNNRELPPAPSTPAR